MSEAAILLAAGASSRFGSDKLLHLHPGKKLPLAACSLLPWLEVFAEITVVVRRDAEEFCAAIEKALANSAIRWVASADASSGMAASLKSGILANHSASGWVVGLADMPSVPASAIQGVRNALKRGAGLCAPYLAGRRGHPVGFSGIYRAELLKLAGDGGAREILARDEARIVRVASEDEGIFLDIDTRQDLRLL